MQAFVDTTVRLDNTSDLFGYGHFHKVMPAPPAGTKRVIYAFRAYYDSIAAITNYTAKAWNHTNYFGLGFNDDVLEFTIPYPGSPYRPDGFFGWLTNRPTIDVSNVYHNDRLALYMLDQGGAIGRQVIVGYSLGGGYRQNKDFLNGMGAPISANLTNLQFGGSDEAEHTRLPARPSDGANFTGAWEIWASAVDKTMYARMAVDYNALADAAMFDAFVAPVVAHTYTLHGDVVSTYRPDFATVVFPNVIKWRKSVPDKKFVFEVVRRRFYDYANNVLGEDES